MGQPRSWQLVHTLIVGGTVLLLVLVGILPWPLDGQHPESRVLTWWIIAALLSVSIAAIGDGLVGRPLGAFIDDRNRMSLSRVQLVVWTILVLAGFYTIVLWNLHTPANGDPLNVGIPQELWWLMGISTTSLVGSPLIKSAKRNKTTVDTEFENKKQQLKRQRGRAFETKASAAAMTEARTRAAAATASLGTLVEPDPTQPEDAIKAEGELVVFSSPEMAGPADLFEGEDKGNVNVLDMGKVQMFYFTVILVLTYAIALLTVLASSAVSVGFPIPDESMVALLGISHAGYLATKTVSHSPTSPTQ